MNDSKSLDYFRRRVDLRCGGGGGVGGVGGVFFFVEERVLSVAAVAIASHFLHFPLPVSWSNVTQQRKP